MSLSLRRQHFRADGQPKKALSPSAAKAVRAKGWHTYLCPICGKTHGSPKHSKDAK